MVPDAGKTSLGLEYFCTENDSLWNMLDPDLIELGKRELERIGLARAVDVEDGCVFRNEKAYPVYDAGYRDCLATVRAFVDGLENRSEEHTSELQSLAYLVCRLLLETKKKQST